MTKFEALKKIVEARQEMAEALQTLGMADPLAEMLPAQVTVTLDVDACLDTYVGDGEEKRAINVKALKEEIQSSADEVAKTDLGGQIKIVVEYGTESEADADLAEEIHGWVSFYPDEPEEPETEEEDEE